MDLATELWAIEERFWLDGAEFFDDRLAPEAVLVLPDPVGILEGPAIAASLQGIPRWTRVETDRLRAVDAGDTAYLAYRATGLRDNDRAYRALCGSIYIRLDGRWLLLAHQQTPSPTGDG